jgi:hypothetical protein
VFGIDRGWKETHVGARIRIPGFYRFIMKYVTPLYLLTVFFFFCKNNLGDWVKSVVDDRIRQGAIALIVAVTVLLIVCLAIGEKRWRAQGLDIDDRQPLTD